MLSTEGLFAGLTFGFVSFLFACAGGWLIMQVVQGELESRQAFLAYLPLLLCWIGIGFSLHSVPMLAGLLFLLAVAWCVMVPVWVITVNARLKQDWKIEAINKSREWVAQHPDNGYAHYRLAEVYEQHEMLKEAYGEYQAAAALDKQNKRAVLRARQLYEEITRKPVPGSPVLSPPPPPPAEESAPPPPAPEFKEPGRIAEFRGAILDDPSNAALHASLADELILHGRVPEATEAYRKALWLDPSNERYRFNLHALLEPEFEPTSLVVAAPPAESTQQVEVGASAIDAPAEAATVVVPLSYLEQRADPAADAALPAAPAGSHKPESTGENAAPLS